MPRRYVAHRIARVFFLFAFTHFMLSCFHENRPPIANAGKDQEVKIGAIVYLDGTGSSDVDGDPLAYLWSFDQKPPNSVTSLANANSPKPQFTVDVGGTYILRLIVNDSKSASRPDTLHVMIINEPPVANIEYTGSLVVNERIALNASKSFDPESQPLFYSWTFSAKPTGSSAVFENPNSVTTAFFPDAAGYYVIKLGVRDGQDGHETTEILMLEVKTQITRFNTKPFAEAGNDIPLRAINVNIQLDGSKSYDLDNDPLTYRWELLLKPPNSNATLQNTNGPFPTFYADVTGSYAAKLIVADNDGESHIDVVVITPHNAPELACQDCHEGKIAKQKPPNHIITFDDCRHCHFPSSWLPASGVKHHHSHVAEVNVCDVCHDGKTAPGITQNHIVPKSDCNYCHTLDRWSPIIQGSPIKPVQSHIGIYSGCLDCHNGTITKGKPQTHMPTSDRCNACHEKNNWVSQLHVEHSQAFSKRCADCHR